MKKEVLKIGIIGAGRFGEFLISSYKDLNEIEVYAICESNKKRAQNLAKKYKIPFYYTNYRELLKKKDIDIVVIVTPPFLHAKLALDSLNAGKNVLCEKPLALSLKEAEKIRRVIKKSKKIFTLDYMFRENKAINLVKEIIDNQVFGKIQNIVFENYARDDNLPENHWFWDKKKSGGIWIEHGVHFFDLFRYLTGQKPIKITSFSVNRNNKIQDQVSALCIYNKGCNAIFLHSFTKAFEIETTKISFCFEKGEVKIKGWIPKEIEFAGLVNNHEYSKLKNVMKNCNILTENMEKIVKGRGKSYKINKKIQGNLVLKETKENLYKDSVNKIMINLVNKIKNKGKLKVTFDDALDSLKDAIITNKNNAFNFKLR